MKEAYILVCSESESSPLNILCCDKAKLMTANSTHIIKNAPHIITRWQFRGRYIAIKLLIIIFLTEISEGVVRNDVSIKFKT
jgi:hypothetical protein